MSSMIRSMQAESLKMRHTFLYPFHIAIPLLGSMIFLAYYSFSHWDQTLQIALYLQIIGTALPFVISIICAGNLSLEEQNHFQIFFGSYTQKWRACWIKALVLMGLGFLAIFAAVILFGTGYHFILGKEGFSAGLYLLLILALFGGSIPLYLEHLFLSLVFPKTVSQCIGIAQSIFSALFLTGLGTGRWMFFPSTWSARIPMLLLSDTSQRTMEKSFLICSLILLIICVIIGIWFHFYEGRQCND